MFYLFCAPKDEEPDINIEINSVSIKSACQMKKVYKFEASVASLQTPSSFYEVACNVTERRY